MTIPDPTYITADEIEEHTLISGLAELAGEDDENIEKLIRTAESQIDDFCGPQPHHPSDSNIGRVFPREQDYQRTGTSAGIVEYPNNPEIPLAVSEACLAQVEWLYTQWWPYRTTSQPTVEHALASRSIGADGSYAEERASGGLDFAAATLCEAARSKLRNYRSSTASLALTRPSDVVVQE